MTSRRTLLYLILAIATASAPAAFADTTAAMPVSATVTGSRSITAAPLAFGDVDVLGGEDITATVGSYTEVVTAPS